MNMKKTFLYSGILYIFIVTAVLGFQGCKYLRARILGDISIKAVSSRSITLDKPVLIDAGKPAATLNAYIGISGNISADGTVISDSLKGPVNVLNSGYQFKGLETGKSYDIYVIAENISGSCINKITNISTAIPQIDPASYPEIANDEMGLFRWYLSVGDDEISDFSKIEAYDSGQGGLHPTGTA
jgi:hypothetical protein